MNLSGDNWSKQTQQIHNTQTKCNNDETNVIQHQGNRNAFVFTKRAAADANNEAA